MHQLRRILKKMLMMTCLMTLLTILRLKQMYQIKMIPKNDDIAEDPKNNSDVPIKDDS